MTPESIAYVVLGVLLIATFISIFFFTYVSKVEGEIVQSQMDLIIANLTDDAGLVLSSAQKQAVGDVIKNNLKLTDMSEQDAATDKSNKALQLKAMKIFGTVITIGIIILIFLWTRYKLNMGEIVKYSLIILVLVALTEYTFVTIVSKNYQMIDPNFVRYMITKTLSDYSKQP